MKTKKRLLLLSILLVLSCNGQDKEKGKINKTEMREKLDLNSLDKKAKKVPISYDAFTYEYTEKKENGDLITINGSKGEGGFTEKKIFAKPSFLTDYKEFYADGYLKRKETYIGEKTKVNTSEYFEENGNVKIIDENKKFGKIKLQDVLKFLERKKVINLSSGSGRFDEDGNSTFEINFDEKKKKYIITIIKGKPNSQPFDGMGEPPAFLPAVYIMDGETGKVEELK
ncbi:hypothetical protein [Chryseobacterium sp. c4a]|uniref:hypothetical protein n=1 Tax=Chryseobacterium sp. c4a TaxID=1573582 RepID=UPI0013574EDE|nr:hypothetical protein [Chryseobacterium sp. c4a]